MATTSTALRNDFCQAVTDLLGAAATMIMKTAADVEVATLALAATPFGAPAVGVITAGAIADDASCTGTTAGSPITKFTLATGGITDQLTGSVSGTSGGGDIEITNTAPSAGTAVSCTALTYTAAS